MNNLDSGLIVRNPNLEILYHSDQALFWFIRFCFKNCLMNAPIPLI